MAAQPLPHIPLRTSHKQSNLCLPTHTESLLLTRQLVRVHVLHVYSLPKSLFSFSLEEKYASARLAVVLCSLRCSTLIISGQDKWQVFYFCTLPSPHPSSLQQRTLSQTHGWSKSVPKYSPAACCLQRCWKRLMKESRAQPGRRPIKLVHGNLPAICH